MKWISCKGRFRLTKVLYIKKWMTNGTKTDPVNKLDQQKMFVFIYLFIFLILARNKKEIEFLQGAFESYKSSLHQEMDDKWNRKKTDLTNELEQQKDKEIHEMSRFAFFYI